jgi:hypothetical protein
MADRGDAARGDLAGLVELDRFAASGMVGCTCLEVVFLPYTCALNSNQKQTS